jgi:3-hydroxyisobutyrate dehydrogenase-like beta-hydroxyacid dehydrogenase
MSDSSQIAIVGLGLVGTAIAERLREQGYAVTGYDLRPEARAAFAEQGHGVVDRATELACLAQCVVLAVFDSHDVVQVVEGEDGLLRPDRAESRVLRSILDCSTGTPELLEALARRVQAIGIDFIEAPLSGSSLQIAKGEATMLLGGELAALQRHDQLLQAISPQRFHVGGAGMGARAKLATNLVLGLNRAALAEGMVFARLLGIEPAQFLQLVKNSPARSGAADAKGAMMVQLLQGGQVQAQSRVSQHLKDVDLMLSAAAAKAQRLPLSETHAALMRATVAAGDGDLDNAAIVRQINRESGR